MKALTIYLNVWTFFVATLLVTWALWIPLASPLSGIENIRESDGALLVILGVFVPSIMGILFMYLTREKAARRDFWRRVISIRRITLTGWLIIVGYPLFTYGTSLLIYGLVTGTLPTFSFALMVFTTPAILVGFLIETLLLGPV